MKYQNGREVSQSVFQAIRYMTKVGVMTRRTWNEFFGHGTLNWKQKQLRLLIKSKVFKPHPFEDVCNTYVIGNYGLEMIQDMKWKSVYHVEPKFIKHDETVARGVWKLELASLCTKWLTERELRRQNSKHFKLALKDGGQKYPDAVLMLQGKTTSPVIALEYEKTAKNSWRYNKAIKAYSDSGEFSFILFVVESDSIENTIKRSMKFIGDTQLNSKIGFISIEDWLRNPSIAEIRGINKIRSISDLMMAS